jgi:predicted tellurium resistance membrane protein TerC
VAVLLTVEPAAWITTPASSPFCCGWMLFKARIELAAPERLAPLNRHWNWDLGQFRLTCSFRQSFHLAAMEWITSPEIWISLLTLTVLEIVLGIDNIIFISILSGKLPAGQQRKARQTGLALALITRVLLLCGLAWVVKLDRPFFETTAFAFKLAVSGKDLILIVGGLFLLAKSTWEIHEKLEGVDGGATKDMKASFSGVIVQIMLLDIVFSLDSVITAVGMVQQIGVMIAAVVIAMIVMLAFVNQISDFVDRHPTIKMLALSFLILIGCVLVAEGFHQHISKGYIYFAMAFSVMVEMLNIRMRKKSEKVELHQPYR